MEIAKDFIGEPPTAYGDPMVYRIRITNTGGTVITDIPLEDEYHIAYLVFENSDPAYDIHDSDAGRITWFDITEDLGDLEPGQTHEVLVNFQLKAFPPYGGAVINLAWSGELEDDAEAETNPSCSDVYANVVELTITPKEGLPEGQNVLILSVPIRNRGPFDVNIVDVYFAYELTPTDPGDDPNPGLIGVYVTGVIPVGGFEMATVEWDVSEFPEVTLPIYIMPIQRDYPECSYDYLQSDITVPVRLASFEARGGNGEVQLTWSTQTEVNNLGFRIYRSGDYFGPFAPLTTRLIPGAGTSFDLKHYAYLDKHVTNGALYFYRLGSVDASGKEELSGIEGAAPSERPAAASFLTRADRWLYEQTERLRLLAKIENPAAEAMYGVTMVVMYDQVFAGYLFNNELVTLPAGFSFEGEIFSYGWTGLEPAGEYTVFAMLTDPVTHEVKTIEATSFRFAGMTD